MTKPDTFTQVYLCQKTASCSPGLEQTRPKGSTGPKGGTKNRHTGPRSPGLDCNLAKGRDKDGENITLRLILQKHSVADIRTPVKVSLKKLGSRTPAHRALRV